MEDFLRMGGYAAFVWPSYGLGLAVIVWNLWSARRLEVEARRQAQKRIAMAASSDADRRDT